MGLDDGADLNWPFATGFGSSVEHISHERKDGWLRKVQAGQAMDVCV